MFRLLLGYSLISNKWKSHQLIKKLINRLWIIRFFRLQSSQTKAIILNILSIVFFSIDEISIYLILGYKPNRRIDSNQSHNQD